MQFTEFLNNYLLDNYFLLTDRLVQEAIEQLALSFAPIGSTVYLKEPCKTMYVHQRELRLNLASNEFRIEAVHFFDRTQSNYSYNIVSLNKILGFKLIGSFHDLNLTKNEEKFSPEYFVKEYSFFCPASMLVTISNNEEAIALLETRKENYWDDF